MRETISHSVTVGGVVYRVTSAKLEIFAKFLRVLAFRAELLGKSLSMASAPVVRTDATRQVE